MLPRYEDICLPLLLEIAERGGETRPSDHRAGENVYDALVRVFNLTREELDEEFEGPPRRSKWETMVQYARWELVKHDCIDGSEYGVWKLTEKGWKTAKSKVIPGFEIKLLKEQLSKLSPADKKKLLELLKEAGVLE